MSVHQLSKAQRRRQLEATIRTTSSNAKAWEHAGFMSAAAKAWSQVEAAQEQLDALNER